MHPIAKEAYLYFAKQSLYLFILDLVLFVFFIIKGVNEFTDLAVATVLTILNTIYITFAVGYLAYKLVKKQQFHRNLIPIVLGQFLLGYLYVWFFTNVGALVF